MYSKYKIVSGCIPWCNMLSNDWGLVSNTITLHSDFMFFFLCLIIILMVWTKKSNGAEKKVAKISTATVRSWRKGLMKYLSAVIGRLSSFLLKHINISWFQMVWIPWAVLKVYKMTSLATPAGPFGDLRIDWLFDSCGVKAHRSEKVGHKTSTSLILFNSKKKKKISIKNV